MNTLPSSRSYLLSSFILICMGWGGLALLLFVFQIPPVVWARWGFFVLWFIALSGSALPVVYFLHRRFSSLPAEPEVVVRQALWVGVYGTVLAWLQLGRLVTLWVWMGLGAGLAAIEYLLRVREGARWTPPQADEPDDLDETRPE